MNFRGSMKRRSSRRRVVIERDEARFHLGGTSSSDDEEDGNERRANEDDNSFAGVRDGRLEFAAYKQGVILSDFICSCSLGQNYGENH